MFSPLQSIVLILLMEMYTAFPRPGILSLPPLLSAALEIALVLLPVTTAFFAGRKLLKQSASLGFDAGQTGLFDAAISRLRMGTCGLMAINLWVLNFGQWVWNINGFHEWRIAAQAIWLIPILVSWCGLWTVSHYVHRRFDPNGQNADPDPGIAVGNHAFPAWRPYMLMNLRGQIPFLAIILLADQLLRLAVNGLNNSGLQSYATAGSLLATLVLFVALPWMLVRCWDSRPLPDGPLRRELQALAAKWKIKFTDIRIVNTHYLIPNAAVLGPGRISRYFLITDLLLESLNHDEILAVFAHEVGHAHHRHIVRYIVALTALELIIISLTGLVMSYWPGHDQLFNSLDIVIVGMAFISGFSRISRQCEHQADWFAARHMAGEFARPPAPAPRPVIMAIPDPSDGIAAAHMPWFLEFENPAPPDQSTSPTPLMAGAGVMADALMRLSEVTHRPLDKPDWMHPSIRDRVNLLFRLANSPDECARFERRMKRLNKFVYGLVLLAMVLMFWP